MSLRGVSSFSYTVQGLSDQPIRASFSQTEGGCLWNRHLQDRCLWSPAFALALTTGRDQQDSLKLQVGLVWSVETLNPTILGYSHIPPTQGP